MLIFQKKQRMKRQKDEEKTVTVRFCIPSFVILSLIFKVLREEAWDPWALRV